MRLAADRVPVRNRPSGLSWSVRGVVRGLAAVVSIAIAGCAWIPGNGPTTRDISNSATSEDKARSRIQIVDVTDDVARRLLTLRERHLFSDTLGNVDATTQILGAGDFIEVNIWEAPPATLFGIAPAGAGFGLAASGARPTTLPEQMIDADGTVVVPFAGRVPAAGKSLHEVEHEIAQRLTGKANQPEVMVRLTRNVTRFATVVGDFNSSLRLQLTPGHERLLDAIAAAGGVRQPVNKMTIQVTRGSEVQSLPLETIIQDPKQNVPLASGDVVTALYAPLSFTALGATGKNEEINFEARGITLAQAIARMGGLIDQQSDARGVFIFRLERKDALDWPTSPVATTPEGMVPVIYRVNLRDPQSFFVMQSFAMNNRDVVFVSDAPVTELQKVLNIVFSVVYPVLNAKQAFGF